MLTMVLNILLTFAGSIGIQVDEDWLPTDDCTNVQQMSGSSQKGSSSGGCTSKEYDPNKPLRIYNGF